jgi:yeast amino acid transporter
MMDEKHDYSAEGREGYAPSIERVVEDKGVRIGEATDMYGDLDTAEEYGYVTRGLKSRHIQFIALGGTIGTGLFLGIGKALVAAGPLSLLLGYTIVGLFAFGMMQCLGEMATWLPLPGAIPQFCARYVDGAMGFAVGWNNWYSCAITLCAEISAASVVIGYWKGAQDISPAPWITLIIILVVCLNIFAVSIYGEAEFIFASIKLVTIVGLLIMALCVDLGASPKGNRIGFWYWQHPGAMSTFLVTDPNRADLGRFLAFFYTLANATFSYGGIETVAVAAGEAENPRRNIPKAVRRVFWRILFFYVLGSLAVGCLVASDDPALNDAINNGLPGAAASPWVIAIKNASIPGLDSVINAVILTSASSSANAFLYTGSRYMYALAQNGQAPRFLLRCSKKGVPYWCVAITASISLLTYLSCAQGGASEAFTWFQNLTTLAQLFTWVSILIAYLKFYYALKAQGIDRNTLVFKSPLQPYLAWSSLVFFSVIIFFNGFYTFSPFTIADFATQYVGVPIYFLLYVVWKLLKRTRWIKSAEVDLHTGKAALDAADANWPEQVPRNALEKFWFWLA